MKDLLTKLLDLLQSFLSKQAGTQPQPQQPASAPAPQQPEPKVAPVVVEPSAPSNPQQLSFTSSNVSRLQDADYVSAAQLLNVEVAAVKAVTIVESNGGGYLPSARPRILYEAHLFGRLTGHKYDTSNPNISSPAWNKALYKGGEKEYDRLAEAMKLDEQAALKSASYGLFQILGSNHKACGYDNVYDFVHANVESEAKQLECFVKFLKSNGLDLHLRNKNWASFAKGYNGPGYAQNQYDVKLKAAYDKFSGQT